MCAQWKLDPMDKVWRPRERRKPEAVSVTNLGRHLWIQIFEILVKKRKKKEMFILKCLDFFSPENDGRDEIWRHPQLKHTEHSKNNHPNSQDSHCSSVSSLESRENVKMRKAAESSLKSVFFAVSQSTSQFTQQLSMSFCMMSRKTCAPSHFDSKQPSCVRHQEEMQCRFPGSLPLRKLLSIKSKGFMKRKSVILGKTVFFCFIQTHHLFISSFAMEAMTLLLWKMPSWTSLVPLEETSRLINLQTMRWWFRESL